MKHCLLAAPFSWPLATSVQADDAPVKTTTVGRRVANPCGPLQPHSPKPPNRIEEQPSNYTLPHPCIRVPGICADGDNHVGFIAVLSFFSLTQEVPQPFLPACGDDA